MRKKKNASEMLHKLQSPIETGFWSTLKQDELLVLCILNTRISEWGKKKQCFENGFRRFDRTVVSNTFHIGSFWCWYAFIKCTKIVGPNRTLEKSTAKLHQTCWYTALLPQYSQTALHQSESNLIIM